MKLAICVVCILISGTAYAQAWRDCIPSSIGPEGGLSIGPGGGQSIGPGDGQSIAPGGGKALDRDRTRGLNPDTLRPYRRY